MKQKVLIVGVVVVLGVLAFVFIKSEAGVDDITNMPPKNNVIVAFGDSLVEGVGSGRGGGFVPILEERIGIEIKNLGVAGDTSRDGLARVAEVVDENPGIVLVLFGGNDALRRIPVSETKGNLVAAIRAIQKDGAVVILLGVRGGLLGDPYDDMYEEIAKETGSYLVPNVLEDILLRPELTYDQLHPNDEGYVIVAGRAERALAEIVQYKK